MLNFCLRDASWAIDRVLSGKNSLLVVPTGSGKSLTFFLPALILGGGARAVLPGGDPGLTIVVSPLISIMNDQLMRLPVHLPGAIFSSGLTAVENANLTSAILNGFLRILFVSPERLCTASFRNLMRLLRRKRQETRATNAQRPVALLCVDEAHCLSQWSFNFRPSFLRIKREIAHIAPRAVLALTATASAAVQRDIMDHLGIPSDGLCTHPPARYNLKLSAAKTSDDTISRNEVLTRIYVAAGKSNFILHNL
jgi:ATP-dependent DNA helicase Q4